MTRRAAIGLVVALGFEEGAREAIEIEALGLKALDIDDLLAIAELWDPLKQRTATNSLVYYARHVEKNSSLAGRIEAFLKESRPDVPTIAGLYKSCSLPVLLVVRSRPA